MRTIKFRGKRKSDGVWIYGWLCEESYISNAEYPWLPQEEIMSETVGQFTGLKDKDGREIYEGDIIRHHERGSLYPVVFSNSAFCVTDQSMGYDLYLNGYDMMYIAVVGNIHDNPELINKKQ